MQKYLLLIILFCSTISFGQNLIKNGNFETTDLSDWSGYNNQNLEDDMTNSRAGNIIDGDGSLFQTLNVNEGETYIVGFDYRWVTGHGDYNLTVRVKEEDTSGRPNIGLTNATSTDGFTLSITPNQWFTNNTFSFTVPTGISKIRLLFYKAKDNRPVRIDNVSVISDTYSPPSFVDTKTPANAQPIGTVAGNWSLDFSDEFNGASLNTAKWYKSISTKTRSPRWDKGIADWRWIEANAFLNNNGALVLRATKTNNSTMRCGSVESRGLYETKYGYLEARIKIAETAKANHTAFWLQGENQSNIDNSAADGAEVDIFESAWTSDTSKAVVHYDGYSTNKKNHTIPFNTPGIHNGYHTYGLLWTENEMHIYYDGKELTSTNTSKPFPFSSDPATGNKLVPNVKEWLWLSVGASFGDGDFKNQPIGLLSDALVDYVRVYKPASTLGLNDLKNDDNLKIYPNPVKNIINIKYTQPNYAVSIFDVNGKEILKKKSKNEHLEIKVNNYLKGVYFIKISLKDKTITKKVVI
jgi:beta-glucanase (GH16 family)